jgi:two-component system OmpR family response regulator
LKILLVEDDLQMASIVRSGLAEAGFTADHADDGEKGLAALVSKHYDLAIIDLMLPKLDGIALITEARSKQIKAPIIILSARGSIEDRVKGLLVGSDDYLTKPFAMPELQARVHALIRRTHGNADPAMLEVGDLSMNLPRHEVRRAGQLIGLKPREYALLEYMMRNSDIVLTKVMIMQHVWNFGFDTQTNVVDVLVCKLRNKIDKDFEFKMVCTIRGAGYMLKSPSASSHKISDLRKSMEHT